MEAVVLHGVGLLQHFYPKQGQDFKPSAALLYLNMGQVPPPPPAGPLSWSRRIVHTLTRILTSIPATLTTATSVSTTAAAAKLVLTGKNDFSTMAS